MGKYSLMQASQNMKTWDAKKIQPADVVPLNRRTKRETSMNEVQRIYKYLFGTTKGFTKFINGLKGLYPNAQIMYGKQMEWCFDRDAVWQYMLNDERVRQRLKAFKIDSYDDMINRTTNY